MIFMLYHQKLKANLRKFQRIPQIWKLFPISDRNGKCLTLSHGGRGMGVMWSKDNVGLTLSGPHSYFHSPLNRFLQHTFRTFFLTYFAKMYLILFGPCPRQWYNDMQSVLIGDSYLNFPKGWRRRFIVDSVWSTLSEFWSDLSFQIRYIFLYVWNDSECIMLMIIMIIIIRPQF